MTDKPLDPRFDRLIASLYSELSAEEEREFQAELASDKALKAEWDELRGTQQWLSTVKAEESSFEYEFENVPEAFEVPLATPASDNRQAPSILTRLSSLFRTPAMGFATAAAALVIMMYCGLRVDRVGGGLMIHFGNPALTPSVETAYLPADGSGVDLNPVNGNADIEQVGYSPFSSETYVTREELMNYTRNVVRLTESRLYNEQNRRDKDMAVTVATVLEALTQQQNRYEQETNSELNRVWLGLEGLEQISSNQQTAPSTLEETSRIKPAIQTTPEMEDR